MAPLRRAQKAERRKKNPCVLLQQKKTRRAQPHCVQQQQQKNQCLANKIVIYSRRNCAGRQTSAATNPARLK